MSKFVLCIALLVGLPTIADPVAAQNGNVLLYNHTGFKVKVCAHRSSDKTWIFPLRCWTLEKNNIIGWNRGNDKFDFDIRVFKPGERLLFESRNLHDVAHLKIKSTYAEIIPRNPPRPPVRKYTVKVCNKEINQPVYFSLAYEVTDHYVVQGWWVVDKGKCLDFPISEMMKEKGGVEYGKLFRTYFYARTFGSAPSFWSGTGTDPTFCINRQGAFETRTEDLAIRRSPCKMQNFELVQMRQVFDPQPGQSQYYLSF